TAWFVDQSVQSTCLETLAPERDRWAGKARQPCNVVSGFAFGSQQDYACSPTLSLRDGGRANASFEFDRFFKAKRDVQSAHDKLSKAGMTSEV
ncbi:hypothetical protein A584_21763, partial [Pseudomonas syringae pv. theae ICMP 3923]